MTETRITSSTGGQKGSKPERHDLIPTGPLRLLAEHYGKGAAKYEQVNGRDNWRNGYDWSLSYAALQRHARAFWSGENLDEETGSPHLVAVAWHAFTLLHFMEREDLAHFDDRQDAMPPHVDVEEELAEIPLVEGSRAYITTDESFTFNLNDIDPATARLARGDFSDLPGQVAFDYQDGAPVRRACQEAIDRDERALEAEPAPSWFYVGDRVEAIGKLSGNPHWLERRIRNGEAEWWHWSKHIAEYHAERWTDARVAALLRGQDAVSQLRDARML